MKLFANITSEAVAKLTSVEFIITAIGATFLVGTIWSNLNSQIAANHLVTEMNKAEIAKMREGFSELKADVKLLKQTQHDNEERHKTVQEARENELRAIERALIELASDRRLTEMRGK